ncbi:MAG: NADH-quinone oxidoreductase subunit M [Dehalococcoidia bacterium]|nr:MAG: NADH-quinone oxidoreductase subunit M [Dehalococcoidia bacterium]
MDFPYLSLIIFLPIAGAILIAFIPDLSQRMVRWIAAVFTSVPLLLALIMFVSFDRSSAAVGVMQFEEKVSWIATINANYHLGVDGLNLPLVLLMAFLGLMVVLISWKIDLRVREYFAWLLLLEASILGVFCALDLLLFFLFWEIEVIPMYFLISIWGSGRKEYSAIKYVIFTLFGSAMMLTGILSLYFTTGSLSMLDIAGAGIGSFRAVIPVAAMFFFLLGGFAVKLPVFPLHTWLPDAHTDAPTAVSVVLAGALLKMGGYGMIRICLGIFPEVALRFASLLAIFAVFTVLYGAAVTLRQTDLKRLIAYSSISHMGYVFLGIFALTQVSLTGATLQMFSHGVITGLLFAVAGLVMHNTEERNLSKLGGLARQMPVVAIIFSVGGLGALGLPSTSGFAAEFLVFLGSFTSTMVVGIKVLTILAVLGVVLTAGYILWLVQRVFYGPVLEEFNWVSDADILEKVYAGCFIAVIMLVGIYPAILTDVIKLGVLPMVGG